MRKLLLIAAVLTFGSPLNAMTAQSQESCRKLLNTVYFMAVGGAPIEAMRAFFIRPTYDLKDPYDDERMDELMNTILVYVYYRIGLDRVVNGKATHEANSRAKKDFCEGQQAALYFR